MALWLFDRCADEFHDTGFVEIYSENEDENEKGTSVVPVTSTRITIAVAMSVESFSCAFGFGIKLNSISPFSQHDIPDAPESSNGIFEGDAARFPSGPPQMFEDEPQLPEGIDPTNVEDVFLDVAPVNQAWSTDEEDDVGPVSLAARPQHLLTLPLIRTGNSVRCVG